MRNLLMVIALLYQSCPAEASLYNKLCELIFAKRKPVPTTSARDSVAWAIRNSIITSMIEISGGRRQQAQFAILMRTYAAELYVAKLFKLSESEGLKYARKTLQAANNIALSLGVKSETLERINDEAKIDISSHLQNAGNDKREAMILYLEELLRVVKELRSNDEPEVTNSEQSLDDLIKYLRSK
jgi:hypothetical protein